MPKYNFTAKNLDSKTVKDQIDARDLADLRKRLKNMDLVLLKYSEVEKRESNYRLKPKEVAEFSRQMASMLDSGITVVRGMEIIKGRDFKPQTNTVFNNLYKDTQNGYTLSEAMKMQNNAFPELFMNMYASGEASGQLERSASKMAEHYEKEYRLNGKIKTAMTYPILLLVFTIIVVLAVFILILPEFFKLFENIDMPPLTKGIIGISSFLQNNWISVIIGIFVCIAACTILLKIPPIRLKVDELKLRVPKLGKLLKIIYTARFSRTLSSLYSSGLTMLNALDISATIMSNKYIESQFVEVVKNVRNGEPLSECIDMVDGFDKKLATTILIGEESGRLDTMLDAVAESYDYEADMATSQMVQLLEPIMIVIMAVMIGTIMLAVLQPIITLYNNVGNL